jgi:ankyrin repeat protein
MKIFQLVTTLLLIVTLEACVKPSPEELKQSLFQAVRDDDAASVKALIKKGADVKSPEVQGGWSALHYAARNGNEEIVSILLANGADPNYVGAASGQEGTHISLKPLVLAETSLALVEQANPFLVFKDPADEKRLKDPKAKERYERVIQILNKVTQRN